MTEGTHLAKKAAFYLSYLFWKKYLHVITRKTTTQQREMSTTEFFEAKKERTIILGELNNKAIHQRL